MKNTIKTAGYIFIFAILAACAMQPIEKKEITRVIEVPNQTQSELFSKSRQWFSETFVSGESVVDYEDKEVGTIIGNGRSSIGRDSMGLIEFRIQYKLRVDTKDGKVRVAADIEKHTNTDSTSTYQVNHTNPRRVAMTEAHINALLVSLEQYLTNQSQASDW